LPKPWDGSRSTSRCDRSSTANFLRPGRTSVPICAFGSCHIGNKPPDQPRRLGAAALLQSGRVLSRPGYRLVQSFPAETTASRIEEIVRPCISPRFKLLRPPNGRVTQMRLDQFQKVCGICASCSRHGGWRGLRPRVRGGRKWGHPRRFLNGFENFALNRPPTRKWPRFTVARVRWPAGRAEAGPGGLGTRLDWWRVVHFLVVTKQAKASLGRDIDFRGATIRCRQARVRWRAIRHGRRRLYRTGGGRGPGFPNH